MKLLANTIELRPHTQFATMGAAVNALVMNGFNMRTYIGRRYDVYENERGAEWAVRYWPTGLVTIEWPEQFE